MSRGVWEAQQDNISRVDRRQDLWLTEHDTDTLRETETESRVNLIMTSIGLLPSSQCRTQPLNGWSEMGSHSIDREEEGRGGGWTRRGKKKKSLKTSKKAGYSSQRRNAGGAQTYQLCIWVFFSMCVFVETTLTNDHMKHWWNPSVSLPDVLQQLGSDCTGVQSADLTDHVFPVSSAYN